MISLVSRARRKCPASELRLARLVGCRQCRRQWNHGDVAMAQFVHAIRRRK